MIGTTGSNPKAISRSDYLTTLLFRESRPKESLSFNVDAGDGALLGHPASRHFPCGKAEASGGIKSIFANLSLLH